MDAGCGCPGSFGISSSVSGAVFSLMLDSILNQNLAASVATQNKGHVYDMYIRMIHAYIYTYDYDTYV